MDMDTSVRGHALPPTFADMDADITDLETADVDADTYINFSKNRGYGQTADTLVHRSLSRAKWTIPDMGSPFESRRSRGEVDGPDVKWTFHQKVDGPSKR